jgi:hypothetical protein
VCVRACVLRVRMCDFVCRQAIDRALYKLSDLVKTLDDRRIRLPVAGGTRARVRACACWQSRRSRAVRTIVSLLDSLEARISNHDAMKELLAVCKEMLAEHGPARSEHGKPRQQPSRCARVYVRVCLIDTCVADRVTWQILGSGGWQRFGDNGAHVVRRCRRASGHCATRGV